MCVHITEQLPCLSCKGIKLLKEKKTMKKIMVGGSSSSSIVVAESRGREASGITMSYSIDVLKLGKTVLFSLISILCLTV